MKIFCGPRTDFSRGGGSPPLAAVTGRVRCVSLLNKTKKKERENKRITAAVGAAVGAAVRAAVGGFVDRAVGPAFVGPAVGAPVDRAVGFASTF